MNLTAARFQIRSAKERENFRNQQEVSRLHHNSVPSPDCNTSNTTDSTFDNLSNNVRGRKEWKPSYVSSRSKSLDWRGKKRQDSRQLQTVDFRDTSDLNEKSPYNKSEDLSNNPNQNKLPSTSKRLPSRLTAQLSVFSERSPVDQPNSDCGRSPLFNVRGRTEWRQTSASTRSKSVEWRGTKNETQRETQTEGNQDAILCKRSQSETSEKKEETSSPLPNELTKSPNMLPVQPSITHEMGDGSQKKPSFSEGKQTNVRGRTEWRQDYTSNRSKSLDWRGRRNKGQTQSITKSITDTIDSGENSNGPSKYFENKVQSTFLNKNDFGSPRNRKPLQMYIGCPERWDSNRIISPAVSGTSRVEMAKVSLAQASGIQTPLSRLRQKQNSHDSTDEEKNNWQPSGLISDKKEHQFSYQLGGLEAKENAGGATTDARSKVFNRDEDIINSDLELKKYTNDSSVGRSSSSISDVKNSLYSPKKGGTFPRTFSKELGIRLHSSSDESSSSSVKENTLSPVSPLSYKRLFEKDSIFLQTGNLESSMSAYDNIHGNILERPKNKMLETISQIKGTETIQSNCSIAQSEPEGETKQTKPLFFSRMTPDSEKPKGDIFEFGGLNSPGKREDLMKKFEVPSLDSVRDKIHKFEALLQQSQSPSHNLHPKRALSVVEAPKAVSGVSKSYSDRYLSLPRGNRERGFLKETHFLSSEDSSSDKSDSSQITTYKERSALQTSKLENEISYGHQNKDNIRTGVKTSITNKHMDEPDQVSHINQKVKSMETNKFSYLNDALAQTFNNKSNGTSDMSYVNPDDFQATKSTASFPNETVSTSESTFNPFSDVSTLGDINNVCNTLTNKKAAAKVSRWIMGDGDIFNAEDDDDYDDGTEREDDSDSGDSSITITSNMSHADHKSFSVRYDFKDINKDSKLLGC